MKNDIYRELAAKYPPTVSITTAQDGWVLLTVWKDDEGKLNKEPLPVVGWIARNNIHPELADYIEPYAALVIMPEFGAVASDDIDVLEYPNVGVYEIMRKEDVETADVSSMAAIFTAREKMFDGNTYNLTEVGRQVFDLLGGDD